MALCGYARVSTEDQSLTAQREALIAAGCSTIFEEKASGGSRGRPQLAHALSNIKSGDTFVVTKIDRLARSLSHLLEIIERLTQGGANFKSLSDPIDTSGPSGRLVLQMLGAVAEFERALVPERTVDRLKHAKSQGRVGGNPGLRARDPEAIAKLQGTRRQTRLAKLSATADVWLPIVRKLRPDKSWRIVLDAVNDGLPVGSRRFTEERLVRSVQLFVSRAWLNPSYLAKQLTVGIARTTRSAMPPSRPPRQFTPAGRISRWSSSARNSNGSAISRQGRGETGASRPSRSCLRRQGDLGY
jgi:DNA invertase Pin-like site-specific DNA recombinase